MTNHSAAITKYISKSFFIVFLSAGFAGFTTCTAQSVIGQWKQVSVKGYCTPEAVQNSHGHLKEVMEMPKVDATEDFHADNTFVETIMSEGKKTVHTGNWSLSGKTLTISVNGDKLVGVVSNGGTTLVCTIESPKAEHMQVYKREWTYTKI